MGTLPFERLECFGPFVAKDGRKENKLYGLIITCLISRAVHIEVLEDMTSDSFINALRNMVVIRGTVSTIRCDQGTNFVCAFNELVRNVNDQFPELNLKFEFNSPHASNSIGGVWDVL